MHAVRAKPGGLGDLKTTWVRAASAARRALIVQVKSSRAT